MKAKRKLQLMVLASLAIAVLLLILNIFFLFRMGSMQKQIDEIREAKVEKVQKEAVNAASAGNSKNDKQVSEDGESSEKDGEDQSSRTEQPDQADPTAAPTPVPGTKYVYLTFDDGPSDNTERILEILDRYKVKATFFVNGREDAKNIERYKKIAEAGHEIAMHSYSHEYEEVYASTEKFTADLDRIQSLVKRVTGKTPMVYRFPGGSSNRLSVRQLPMQSFVDVLDSRGIAYFDWNVDTTDGEGADRPVETLISEAQKNLGKTDQSVVLMHDAGDHNTTVEALPSIIQSCIDRGLTFDVITAKTPPVHHTLAD